MRSLVLIRWPAAARHLAVDSEQAWHSGVAELFLIHKGGAMLSWSAKNFNLYTGARPTPSLLEA